MHGQEQRNAGKVRTSFTNCHCDFPEFFAFFQNCGSTARQLSSAERIWVNISTAGTPERSTLKR